MEFMATDLNMHIAWISQISLHFEKTLYTLWHNEVVLG